VIITTRAELARVRRDMAGPVAVVMTMGALHAGHAALLRRARQEAKHVIATIFVNPLQFGPAEDYQRYPRTLADDARLCEAEKVDVVFAPDQEEMYPNAAPAVRIEPGPLAAILEGAIRPGHFDGVLTVVGKLLNLTQADLAYFGEKDYQQLTLIRSMVRDLDFGVRVVAVPTVRESDGLALSSRNRYLSATERDVALALSRCLRAAERAAGSGLGGSQVLAAARAELAEPAISDLTQGQPMRVDYVELTDPWLGPPPERGDARLLVAGKVGSTRLIDNVAIVLRPADHQRGQRAQPVSRTADPPGGYPP
jgi:pantoate--beta-alanine ligase